MTKKEIIYLDDIPSRAILVWEYLGHRENKDHQCWPSINRMASELHLSRSTVKRALHGPDRNRLDHRRAAASAQRLRHIAAVYAALQMTRFSCWFW